MSVDVSLCEQIRCGAITQSMAGNDLLLACAEAGYTGSYSCGFPQCAPYMDEMIANGTCPPAYPMAPAPTPIYVPSNPALMPSATNTCPPSITGVASTGNPNCLSPTTLLQPLPQIVPPPPIQQTTQICSTFTAWVSTNPILAVGLLVVGYFIMTDHKRTRTA